MCAAWLDILVKNSLSNVSRRRVYSTNPNACYQETVRAQIETVYKKLIDIPVEISGGTVALPTRPGLGVELNPDLFDPKSPGYRRSDLEQ